MRTVEADDLMPLPLHVLVHRDVPGDHNQLAVAGTAEAAAFCSAGIIND